MLLSLSLAVLGPAPQWVSVWVCRVAQSQAGGLCPGRLRHTFMGLGITREMPAA